MVETRLRKFHYKPVDDCWRDDMFRRPKQAGLVLKGSIVALQRVLKRSVDVAKTGDNVRRPRSDEVKLKGIIWSPKRER